MKKIVDIDRIYNCEASKAIKRFFKSHPELDYWKELFEWMEKTGTEFFSDNRMANGSRNTEWTYGLHLDQYDGTHTYIAIIERE